MSEPTPPPPAKPRAHSVVCETHGLRYNPEIHNGCARCRRERGELLAAPPHAAPDSANSGTGAKAGSLGAAVGVALALIAGSGMLLYIDDLRTWKKVQELRESGNYIEGLTPEQQEQFEQLQRQMERMLDGSQKDDQDEGEED